MKNFTDIIQEKPVLTLKEKLNNFILKNISINEDTMSLSLSITNKDKIIEAILTLLEQKDTNINEMKTFKFDLLNHRLKLYKVDKDKLKSANLNEDTKKALNKELQSSNGLLCVFSELLEEVGVYGAFTDNFLENIVFIPRNILVSFS